VESLVADFAVSPRMVISVVSSSDPIAPTFLSLYIKNLRGVKLMSLQNLDPGARMYGAFRRMNILVIWVMDIRAILSKVSVVNVLFLNKVTDV
jgi:hypothetical protein